MTEWTLATLHEHLAALRAADKELAHERDRRYTEGTLADKEALKIKAEGDQKALQIKDEGDQKALILAREIQTYKDQQHNGVLDQLKDERATYATKSEMVAGFEKVAEIIKPLADYATAQQGRSGGLSAGWGYLLAAIGAIGTLLAIGITLLTLFRR
jgi:hypothetical protein